MNNEKLQAKDFNTIGIFTALLFVVEFACGMLGFTHPYIVASYRLRLGRSVFTGDHFAR